MPSAHTTSESTRRYKCPSNYRIYYNLSCYLRSFRDSSVIFIQKRSGSAIFRSVGDCQSASKEAQPNRLCYKVATSVILSKVWVGRVESGKRRFGNLQHHSDSLGFILRLVLGCQARMSSDSNKRVSSAVSMNSTENWMMDLNMRSCEWSPSFWAFE